MDDRRFDALVKSVASGGSRRAMLKGILGLGSVAFAGGAILGDDARAQRRPTPTPKPIRCPGTQTPCPTGCCCPVGFEKCGPDCCTEANVPAPLPGHSECCDNACCFGTCYGEELCCPTNNRSTGEFPIPPTHKICTSIDNGTQCCDFDQDCCSFDGCCDTLCWGEDSFCCPNDGTSYCPGGSESPDICCVNVENTIYGCCNGGTNANRCIPIDEPGACCTDADCGACDVCDPETNVCGPGCDEATEVCCSDENFSGICILGTCCSDSDCGEDGLCCLSSLGAACAYEGFCPNPCSAEDPCNGCATCIGGLCRSGCAEGEDCCFTGAGDRCFEAGSCGPNLCICEGGIDCCIIDNEYVCVDLTQAGVCCADTDCAEFDDVEHCLVGVCGNLVCEQQSTCAASQYCCDGECSDVECPQTGECESDQECGENVFCCAGLCCLPDQFCVEIANGVLRCLYLE